jgi:hypothetical protein
MSTLQSRLAEEEHKLSTLQSLLSSDVMSLRESLLTLRASVQNSQAEHGSAALEVEEGIMGMLAALLEQVSNWCAVYMITTFRCPGIILP